MSEQPISDQVSKLTQLLTMTTTHKFSHQDGLNYSPAEPDCFWYAPCSDDNECNPTSQPDKRNVILAMNHNL